MVKMGQIFFPSLALLPTLQWCLYTRRDADATALSLGPRLVGSCLGKDIDSSPTPPSRVLKEPCVHAIDFFSLFLPDRRTRTAARPDGPRTDGFSVRECSRLRPICQGEDGWVRGSGLRKLRSQLGAGSYNLVHLFYSHCVVHTYAILKEDGRTDGRRPRKSGGGVKLGPSGAVFFFCSFSF